MPIRLTRNVGKVTYVLYWVLENEEAHAKVSKLGLELFYKKWTRCLTTMPKIYLEKILCKSISTIPCMAQKCGTSWVSLLVTA